MKKAVSLALIFVLMFLAVPGLSMNSSQRETEIIKAGVAEIERYLLEDPVDLDTLLDTLSSLHGSGNYLYRYVLTLQQVEQGSFGRATANAEDLWLDDRFADYLNNEIGSWYMGNADDLLYYVLARSADYDGDAKLAYFYYKQCYAYFDARARSEKCENAILRDAYKTASNYYDSKKWYEAYLYLKQLSEYEYEDSKALCSWIERNQSQVKQQTEKAGIDWSRSETIPEEYELFYTAVVKDGRKYPSMEKATPEPTSTPKPTVEPTAAPTREPTPVKLSYSNISTDCSSYRPANQNGGKSVSSKNAFDGDSSTAWNSNNAVSNQWISVSNSYKWNVTGFTILSGYYSSYYNSWSINTRPRTLSVYADGAYITSFVLEDTRNEQRFNFPYTVSCYGLTFNIDDVYYGSSYKDICITEISLYGYQ